MNETQNTIQKIEESLARQNYNYNNEADPIRKIMRVIWISLGLVLLTVIFITVTGWLTIGNESTNENVYQTNR